MNFPPLAADLMLRQAQHEDVFRKSLVLSLSKHETIPGAFSPGAFGPGAFGPSTFGVVRT